MAITLTLSGDTYTSSMLVGSLSITDGLNGRNTCAFDIIAPEGGWPLGTDSGDTLVTDTGDTLYWGARPTVGQEVIIMNGATKAFAGTVDEIVEEKYPGTDALRYSVECVDYNQLADRHLVARSYDSQTLGAIVSDIVTQDLTGESITTTYVQTGPTITKAVFNWMPASDCFNELAEETGFIWWIDYDKVLHFCSRDTNVAPFGLTDTSGNFRNLTVRRTREKYANRQYVRAGYDKTDTQTETAKGDGETRVFTLKYPIAEVPTVTVDAVSKTVGIKGVDTGKDFYWNKGDPFVTQDDAGTKLTTSNTLSVSYKGFYPLMEVAQDDDEIAAMAASEGGTGVYEAIEDWPNIESRQMAANKADALLRIKADIPETIEYETDEDGLTAGMLQSIVIEAHQLSANYLIESVKAQDVDGLILRYKVKALSGESLGGWEKFFATLAANGRQFVVRENEVVTYMRRTREQVTVTDTPSYTTSAPETRCGFALAGYSEAGV